MAAATGDVAEAQEKENKPPQQTLAEQVGSLRLGCKDEPLDMASEWTLEEDCFLIRHFGIRKTPLKQIEGKYVALKTKRPEAYTKDGCSLDQMRQRYDALSSPGSDSAHRYSVLQSVEAKLCALEDAADAASRGEAPRPETGAEGESEVKVDVKVVDLSGRARSKLVSRDKAMDASRRLCRMIEDLPEVVDKPNAIPEITLDANAFEFEKGRKYEVIQYPVVERALLFFERPECVQQVLAHEERDADALAAQQDQIDRVRRELEHRRDAWLRRTSAKAAADTDALRAQNEADFEHHTRHIRHFFNRRLEAALSEQQRRARAAEDAVELYFAQQEQRLKAMLSELLEADRKAAANDTSLQQSQEAVAYVFESAPDGSNYTMKLGLAAKLLESSALDEACRAMLRRQPRAFVQCKEWQSELILEPYHREMLPTLSALELAELEGLAPPDSWLSAEHVQADLRMRRRIAQEELRRMTNEALHKVLCMHACMMHASRRQMTKAGDEG